jgi:hypothetical protein
MPLPNNCVVLDDTAAFKGWLRALEAKTAQENLILTESWLAALERAKEEKKAHGG